MANSSALPVRIGLLYDFPQMGDLLAKSLQMGVDEVAATGRLDRGIELVERQSQGLPSGTEAEVKRAFAELDDEGVVAIIGPSISDNGLIAAPLCDAAQIPAINYTGGERTRSEWMFHYQVGSLEEEPPVLAARGQARLQARGGHLRPVARRPALRRVLRSGARPPRPRGHGHREHLSLAEDATEPLDRLSSRSPTCSCTSASACRRAPSRSGSSRSAGRCRCSRTRR